LFNYNSHYSYKQKPINYIEFIFKNDFMAIKKQAYIKMEEDSKTYINNKLFSYCKEDINLQKYGLNHESHKIQFTYYKQKHTKQSKPKYKLMDITNKFKDIQISLLSKKKKIQILEEQEERIKINEYLNDIKKTKEAYKNKLQEVINTYKEMENKQQIINNFKKIIIKKLKKY